MRLTDQSRYSICLLYGQGFHTYSTAQNRLTLSGSLPTTVPSSLKYCQKGNYPLSVTLVVVWICLESGRVRAFFLSFPPTAPHHVYSLSLESTKSQLLSGEQLPLVEYIRRVVGGCTRDFISAHRWAVSSYRYYGLIALLVCLCLWQDRPVALPIYIYILRSERDQSPCRDKNRRPTPRGSWWSRPRPVKGSLRTLSTLMQNGLSGCRLPNFLLPWGTKCVSNFSVSLCSLELGPRGERW